MEKEMVRMPMNFEFLWGWSLLHSPLLVLTPHVLIIMKGGLPHQPPLLASNDRWLGILIRHMEKGKG
jgi:hypothetical protein